MSQQKVDKYKEYKANRKEILAKQKRRAKLTKIAVWAVVVLIICAIIGGGIYAGVKNYQDFLASVPDYTASTLLFSDMVGVLSEDETDDTSQDDETDDTSEEDETDDKEEEETDESEDAAQESETDESGTEEPESETDEADGTDGAEESVSAEETE